jgi:hypothetical protein
MASSATDLVALILGIGFASVFLGPGLYIVLKPYKSATFIARLRSVGTQTEWEDVEPERWFVTLTRFIGLFYTSIGAYILYSGLVR